MKKYLILIISLFIISTSILVGCTQESIYPKGGKDSEKEFGDARFVILVGYNSDKNKKWSFYDRKELGKTIDINVEIYKDIKPFAYTIGESGYTRVNYEDGEIKQAMTLDEFNDDDRDIFNELNIKKSDVKK